MVRLLPQNLPSSVLRMDRLLGRMMGKALKDGRMLDLPLGLPLCSLIVGLRRQKSTMAYRGGGDARPLTLDDVRLVDSAVGKSLKSVAKLADEVARAKVSFFKEM